ncbi:MAG: thioredoxin [Planctomycetaceae bacterium]
MAGNVKEFNDNNFQSEVLESDTPVLVDFWAPWCGPCKMLAPTIDELANDLAGKVKVGKVNTDEARQIAIQHQIQSIPTLMLFKGGKVVERTMGAQPKQMIAQMVAKHVS